MTLNNWPTVLTRQATVLPTYSTVYQLPRAAILPAPRHKHCTLAISEERSQPRRAMRGLVVPLLLLVQLATAAAAANIALAGCESKCGDVDVPYPFGTTYGCHRTGFKVTCDRAYQPPRLFLQSDGPEVLAISVRNSTVRVRATAWSFAAGNASDVRVRVLPAKLRPYVLSATRNSFVLVGCGFQAAARTAAPLRQGAATTFGSCAPSCPADDPQKLRRGVCHGVGCCESPIPTGLKSFRVQFSWQEQNATARPPWVTPGASVLTVEQEWWRDRENVVPVKLSLLNSGNATGFVIPAVLDVLGAERVVVRGGGDGGGGEGVRLWLRQQEQRVPQLHEQRLRLCVPVQRRLQWQPIRAYRSW